MSDVEYISRVATSSRETPRVADARRLKAFAGKIHEPQPHLSLHPNPAVAVRALLLIRISACRASFPHCIDREIMAIDRGTFHRWYCIDRDGNPACLKPRISHGKLGRGAAPIG